jgi:hypothetical protein
MRFSEDEGRGRIINLGKFGLRLINTRDIRFDHFGWINYPVELDLGHKAELQRGVL